MLSNLPNATELASGRIRVEIKGSDARAHGINCGKT